MSSTIEHGVWVINLAGGESSPVEKPNKAITHTDYDFEEPGGDIKFRRGLQVIEDLANGIPTLYDLRIFTHDTLFRKLLNNTITLGERNRFTRIINELIDDLGTPALYLLNESFVKSRENQRCSALS